MYIGVFTNTEKKVFTMGGVGGVGGDIKPTPTGEKIDTSPCGMDMCFCV